MPAPLHSLQSIFKLLLILKKKKYKIENIYTYLYPYFILRLKNLRFSRRINLIFFLSFFSETTKMIWDRSAPSLNLFTPKLLKR